MNGWAGFKCKLVTPVSNESVTECRCSISARQCRRTGHSTASQHWSCSGGSCMLCGSHSNRQVLHLHAPGTRLRGSGRLRSTTSKTTVAAVEGTHRGAQQQAMTRCTTRMRKATSFPSLSRLGGFSTTTDCVRDGVVDGPGFAAPAPLVPASGRLHGRSRWLCSAMQGDHTGKAWLHS